MAVIRHPTHLQLKEMSICIRCDHCRQQQHPATLTENGINAPAAGSPWLQVRCTAKGALTMNGNSLMDLPGNNRRRSHTPIQRLSAAGGGLGGLLYGIDVGIIGGALPYLEATSNLTAAQLSVIVAAVLLGSVFSTLVCGMLADWMGRKPLMILSGLTFVVSIPGDRSRRIWAAVLRAAAAGHQRRADRRGGSALPGRVPGAHRTAAREPRSSSGC
jgi:hypothetical protein